MATRSWVTGLLWTGTVKVTFTKKDGSLRTIFGTQDPTRIPFYVAPKKTVQEIQEDTSTKSACPIFDLDLKEWRSFRWDSVVGITNETGMVLYEATQDGALEHEHQTTTA